jgi:hypothetical protein
MTEAGHRFFLRTRGSGDRGWERRPRLTASAQSDTCRVGSLRLSMLVLIYDSMLHCTQAGRETQGANRCANPRATGSSPWRRSRNG